MTIILLIYAAVGALFIYASQFSKRERTLSHYIKLLLSVILWPVCIMVYFICLLISKKERDELINHINNY